MIDGGIGRHRFIPHRSSLRFLLAAIALLVGMAAAQTAAAAVPSPLWKAGGPGSGGAQLERPRGVAVDPDLPGHIYVADQLNARIVEFDPWGQFVKTWGWGTVASGPNNDPRNEVQLVSVDATAGTFKLSPSFTQTTAPIAFNATAVEVRTALEGFTDLFTFPGEIASNPGDFAVSGPNGGPWTIEFTGANADTDIAQLAVVGSTLTGGSATASTSTTQPGANFEICVPAEGDTCRSSEEARPKQHVGSAPGQFAPQGVALDSAGDVYVVDFPNHRVQKFDSSGNFLLMFGGGVNQGPNNPGDVCTTAHLTGGDTCGEGTTGLEPGEFGAWPWIGDFISTDAAGNVSVGDDERIEKFGSNGAFLEEIHPPALAGDGFVKALTQDAAGNYYVAPGAFLGSTVNLDVDKLSATGATLCTITGSRQPRAITVDGAGWVYVARQTGLEGMNAVKVDRFDSACGNQEEPFGTGELSLVDGIATGGACLSSGVNVYVTNAEETSVGESFIRAYGSPPDDPSCPPPALPPTIAASFATSVDTDGAAVKARINPHFWKDASYYVEYGTGKCSEGGCDRLASAPGVQLGAGIVDLEVTTAGVFLSGLQPDTTYRYRFVAQSGGGGPVQGAEASFTTMPALSAQSDNCPNAALRIGPARRLADCRAYEMVSPIDKQGSDLLALTNFIGELARRDRAAASGEQMTYSSYRAFADPQSAPYMSQYLASRTATGWSSRSISPPRKGASLTSDKGLDSQFMSFSEDLSQAWLVHDTEPVLAPGGVPGFGNVYRRDNNSDSYVALSTVEPANIDAKNYFLEVLGASEGGAHTVFAADDYLPAGGPGRVTQIYDSLEGAVSPVCILPSKARSSQTCFLGTGNSTAKNTASVEHAISKDGSRIYWTATSGQVGAGRIYVRISGDQTLAVSDLAKPGAPAQFWTAAADGSKAIFTIQDGSQRLYEFDLASKSVKQIAGDVQGVAAASEDVSRIYFVSKEVLDGGALAGKANLYLYEAGETASFELVATLGSADVGKDFSLSPIEKQPRWKTARATPDGMHLVFMSQAALTGADNIDAQSGQADSEVFHYDATSEQLVCISCNRTGARPTGRNIEKEAVMNSPYWASGQIPTSESQIYSSRVISTDGTRVFFESFQRLAAGDTNGKQDVYEWEELGAGTCTASETSYVAAAGGCVTLISSGESPQDSELLDASANGSDVFFTTASSLVAQDPGLVDVYDARAGGGFPPPPPAPRRCEGEACLGTPVAPNDPTPASATFRGAGSPTKAGKPRCAKGKRKVRRGGRTRCVSKQRRPGHPRSARRQR